MSAAAAFLLLHLTLFAQAADSPPRATVFIVADDLGYNEFGFANASRGLRTPHIDTLASGGVRLTHYYTPPLCSPTRASIMTGRYAHRLGLQSNVVYWDTPWGVPLNETFLPQELHAAGVAHTAMFGKWHIGMHAPAYWPTARGFDRYEGYLQGCGSQDTHVASCCSAPANASNFTDYVCDAPSGKDYRGLDWFNGTADGSAAAHGTSSSELIAAAAERAIADFAASGERFFLYLPFQNIHAPYDARWESVEPFVAAGMNVEQATMFGYIYELDLAVGRVLAALRAAVGDDVVVVLVSDNGAPPAPNVEGRNYPLRGFKAETWEGGTRVPGAVYAPGRLPAGAVCDSMVHASDWLPTLVGLHGGSVRAGLDGVNQWSTLGGAPASRGELVINANHLCDGGQFGPPKAALRVGDLKLLCYCFSAAGIAGANTTGCHGGPAGEWPQLYNVTADPGETRNLAAAMPAAVAALEARLAVLAGPGAAAEPMQWVPPYQGPDYYCRTCSLRPATGPNEPWGAWLPNPPTEQ